MKYNWNWSILITEPYLGWILSGLLLTMLVSLAAWIIAFTLGSLLGIARTRRRGVLYALATGYVELFRNVPLLVQIFLWYFILPEVLPKAAGHWVKRELPDAEYWTAVVALGLYTACRVAEQVRAGIEAIPKGQSYAGLAAGLTRFQIYRYILLPVGYRIIVPTLTSEFLTIFKNSSLALTIGVLELTARSRQITEYTFQGFEAFAAATLLYILVTLTVTFAMRFVEIRTRIPGMIALGRK